MKFSAAVLSAALALASFAAAAADYPAPKQGEWIAKDFKFHTGESLQELRLHYTTVGEPTGQPVLVLHGSGGSAANMLTPAFAGELFGAGQPLDATASAQTRGHSTTGNASFYAQALRELLQNAPQRSM